MSQAVDNKFSRAYHMARNTQIHFPPDILLNFYAYYKKATEKNGFFIPPSTEGDLRSAFKVNALLQVKNLSKEEAQQKYIAMVEEYIGKIPE